MNVIRLLPDHIANQIAAGEVIQRPASVVKELVENAIDAGSGKIHILIKDSGKTLIQVIDNGQGMSADDARMSFERHATSKISTADDLFALKTKGFRGEALASIAAIAQVNLKTKKADQKLGTNIQIEGSRLSTHEQIVCANGTSFEVKNIFYNVPARRNFLKSDQIEFRHICDEFERLALAHPEIHFILDHNDKSVHNLPATNLRKRIIDAVGKSINDKLVPIEENTDIVKITGFVGKPEHSKKKRGEQFFFVNNRYFKESYFNHAIVSAYDNLLPSKHHPSYFLFFEIDAARIDVNVHPTKTEIKFEEDKYIYSIIRSAVKQALGKYNLTPALDFERENSFDLPYHMKNKDIVEPQIKVNPNYNPFNGGGNGNSISSGNNYSSAMNKQGFGDKKTDKAAWENFYNIEEEKQIENPLLIEVDSQLNFGDNFIEHGAFIAISNKSNLTLVHRRRAIHRIIYDEMMAFFISKPINSQTMLFPIEKELSNNEILALNGNESLLKRMGFNFEIGKNIISISAVPEVLQQEGILPCLEEIIHRIGDQELDKGELAHVMINSIAQSSSLCKLEKLNDAAYKHLLGQLLTCENHNYSPNGKLIINEISMDELQQKF